MTCNGGEGEIDTRGQVGEKYLHQSGCSYETRALMLVMLSSEKKLGEKGEEDHL